MSENIRINGGGKVGEMVVLDHVSLGGVGPFAKYQQPAFFVIESVDQDPHPGIKTSYTLRDTQGVVVDTKGTDIHWFLMRVTQWDRWRSDREEQTRTDQTRKIATLRDRVELLKEIMEKQGVRVITTEQAQTLGIKR
jgi:hypothetical protein